MPLPQRKPPRLAGYDYAQNGAYFVTFCTVGREPVLSTIHVGSAALCAPQVELTALGVATERYIRNIPKAYPNVSVEKYVIMPNHVHLLLLAESGGQGAALPTVSAIVRSVKAMVTKAVGRRLFQTSFHDHIIRNEDDYLAHWNYIEENPLRWELDEYHTALQEHGFLYSLHRTTWEAT